MSETFEPELDSQLDDIEESSENGPEAPVTGNADQLAESLREEAEESAQQNLMASLVTLGFVAFDGSSSDNTTANLMISDELRQHFRRDTYVAIDDAEQGIEFLGRVVEGPFHSPHEIGSDSAISRTTLLYPERTQFRPTYYAEGTIEILGAIRDGERVVPTPTRPRPYSRTTIFPPARLQRMLGLEGDFNLGHLMGYEQVPVFADVSSKNFLPRNVGVFGTVGSGKSNTTQVLMEEATAAGWAVVVIDVEGEYVRMNEATDDDGLTDVLRTEFHLDPAGVPNFRVYVPASGTSDAANPTQFKIPISRVQTEIVGDILEFSEPQYRMFATITNAAARAARQTSSNRQGPFAPSGASGGAGVFTLQDLIDGLDEDNGLPLLQNPKGPELATAGALRSKLIGLGRSGMLDWGATSATSYLAPHELLVGGRLSVIDVSETDDRSRGLGIAYILQSLFEQVIETDVGEEMPVHGGARPRLLVVIEEVHTFISRATVQRMRAVLDQLQIISRRGRKRWMGLTLVSQQPGHVPDELFELANTRFIHQLKSTSNLAPVKQTTGGVHEALWGTVPALGPGQCLLTGAMFRNPIFVSMRPARSRRMLIN
ncbi:MAG TPA: ATP-binding protein [Gaiellaceae bacterium]|nr:ATP-binding protein [Gaiellaceae bacterium]